LEYISERLKADLPGLAGFSLTSMKNMRKFYEAWSSIEGKSATAVADFQSSILQSLANRQSRLAIYLQGPLGAFAPEKALTP